MNAIDQQIESLPPFGQSECDLLAVPEKLRSLHFAAADAQLQKDRGQFLTPPHVADLMAGLFSSRARCIRLLDAGAGMGILSAAFVKRQLMRDTPPTHIEVTAYELDKALMSGIEQTFDACRVACEARGVGFSATIRNADFIAVGAEMIRNDFFSTKPQTLQYSHCQSTLW